MSAFWNFNQNNSGGFFDKSMGHQLFVEANSAEEANQRAQTVGVYFGGCAAGVDCDCCGDRWYPASGSPDANDILELRSEIKRDLAWAKSWGLGIGILFIGQSEILMVHGVSDAGLLEAA